MEEHDSAVEGSHGLGVAIRIHKAPQSAGSSTVNVNSEPPLEYEPSSSFAKTTSHQNDPGYRNPGHRERNFKFSCCFVEWRRRAKAKTPYSVASSGDIGVGSFPLIGHDRLLLVLSEFFLFLLGIQELIPG